MNRIKCKTKLREDDLFQWDGIYRNIRQVQAPPSKYKAPSYAQASIVGMLIISYIGYNVLTDR